MIFKHYCFYVLCILCVIHLYSLTPVQRGNIQELTKLIKTDKVTESEARARAQELNIPAKQRHDFIVQQLIDAANEKGMRDLFAQTAKAAPAPDKPLVQKNLIYTKEKPETTQKPQPSLQPTTAPVKPSTPPATLQLPDEIRNRIETYVNKEYKDADAVLTLRNKNFEYKTGNPYQGISKQEALEKLETVAFRWIKDEAFAWDIRNAIDIYYQLVLAKMRFKELNEISAFQKVNQALVKLLSKNGATTSLVFDLRNNNAKIPNKYFIELVDEFERAQSAPVSTKPITPPIVVEKDFPTQKIDKSLHAGDERDYYRDEESRPEHEELTEQEEPWLGVSSIKR